MNVRIFWVRAMKCMCAQTRPRFILSSERVFGGMEFEPMLTPREKSSLPENVPRRGSNPRRCGQRAQALPTELFRPPPLDLPFLRTDPGICHSRGLIPGSAILEDWSQDLPFLRTDPWIYHSWGLIPGSAILEDWSRDLPFLRTDPGMSFLRTDPGICHSWGWTTTRSSISKKMRLAPKKSIAKSSSVVFSGHSSFFPYFIS